MKIPPKPTYPILVYLAVLFSFFSGNSQEKDVDSLFNATKSTFTAVPLINNNPAMKTGFGGMAMYFFKLDKKDSISPPSNVRFIGLYSTNDSYVMALSSRLFWKEDKNRATFITGTTNINNNFLYEIEGTDVRLVFTEQRKFVTAEYSRKIIGELYLGLLYLGTKTVYKFDKGTQEENDFTKEFFENNGIEDNFVSSLGFNISYDTRDYVYYPTKGLMFSIRPKFNGEWLGSENNYVDTDYVFNYYTSLASNKILATAVSGGIAWGDVPFDGYQNYGIRNTLRGYSVGKYKGKYMVAVQAEYRWRFYKKWGMVGFAGIGSVWGNDREEEAFEKAVLPSAGAGLRFMVSPEKKINLRLDYAFGIDGNQGLYFGVMEAF